MIERRCVTVEGRQYTVTISDQDEALLSAAADGGAVIGIWNPADCSQKLWSAPYLVESSAHITGELLERVVRRKLGLPWLIGSTDRLLIRELTLSDGERIREEPDCGIGDAVFYDEKAMEAYIRSQYGFYEYGIWAVVERASGCLAGLAGVSPGAEADGEPWLELGYHMFIPYRRRGYGLEACRAVRDYVQRELNARLYLRIKADNPASARLARALGFKKIQQPPFDIYYDNIYHP